MSFNELYQRLRADYRWLDPQIKHTRSKIIFNCKQITKYCKKTDCVWIDYMPGNVFISFVINGCWGEIMPCGSDYELLTESIEYSVKNIKEYYARKMWHSLHQ